MSRAGGSVGSISGGGAGGAGGKGALGLALKGMARGPEGQVVVAGNESESDCLRYLFYKRRTRQRESSSLRLDIFVSGV